MNEKELVKIVKKKIITEFGKTITFGNILQIIAITTNIVENNYGVVDSALKKSTVISVVKYLIISIGHNEKIPHLLDYVDKYSNERI